MFKKRLQQCDVCFASIAESDEISFKKHKCCRQCSEKIFGKNNDSSTAVEKPESWTVYFSLVFILAVFPMDYEFYLVLKVIAFFGFSVLAYTNIPASTSTSVLPYHLIFGALVILYNPFFPISLTKEIWLPINIITAIIILFYSFSKEEKLKKQQTLQSNSQSKILTPQDLRHKKLVESEPQTNRESEVVSQVISLIVDPLIMQKIFISSYEVIGDEYLQTQEALGFVAGFTDGFLQKTKSRHNLSADEEIQVVSAVIAIVFEGTDQEINMFWDLQEDDDFRVSQIEGGNCAYQLLDDPKNKSAQMGWYQHMHETFPDTESETILSTDPNTTEFTEKNTEIKSSYSHDLKSYFLRGFGVTSLGELPSDFTANDYITGIATGYHATVLDGVMDGLNWSKQERGEAAINFMKEVFEDPQSISLKVLKDPNLANEVILKKQFIEGRNHGSILASATYSVLKKHLNEPLINTCRNFSKTSNSDLSEAVFLLTVQQYILTEWPSSIQTLNSDGSDQDNSDCDFPF